MMMKRKAAGHVPDRGAAAVTPPVVAHVHEFTDAEVDENLIGTFPASDPPSWTLGVPRTGEPQPAGKTHRRSHKSGP
jgi:hypothetical protein